MYIPTYEKWLAHFMSLPDELIKELFEKEIKEKNISKK